MDLFLGIKKLQGNFVHNIQRNKLHASSSLDFLSLSQQTVYSIEGLIYYENVLNKRQCVDLSYKLCRAIFNMQKFDVCCKASIEILSAGLECLCKILEKAKFLMKRSCNDVWIIESIFQIGNEKDFQVILLEVELCYYVIYEHAILQ